MKNKTFDLKNEKDCESFVYALTGLTLDEYARKILEQFNKEKKERRVK